MEDKNEKKAEKKERRSSRLISFFTKNLKKEDSKTRRKSTSVQKEDDDPNSPESSGSLSYRSSNSPSENRRSYILKNMTSAENLLDSRENNKGSRQNLSLSMHIMTKYEINLKDYLNIQNLDPIFTYLSNYSITLDSMPNLSEYLENILKLTDPEKNNMESNNLVIIGSNDIFNKPWHILESKIIQDNKNIENANLFIEEKYSIGISDKGKHIENIGKISEFNDLEQLKVFTDMQSKFLFRNTILNDQKKNEILRIPNLRESFYTEHSSDLQPFSFHLNSINFGVSANNEPINLTFFVYDRNMKQKLCEEFHIRCNANGVVEKHKNITTFINKRTHDAWIVIIGTKIFRPNNDYSIYTQTLDNPKEKEKYEMYTQRILASDLVQWEFLFWSAKKLFNKDDPVEGDVDLKLYSNFPQNLDESIQKLESQKDIKLLKFNLNVKIETNIYKSNQRFVNENKIIDSFHTLTKMHHSLKNRLHISIVSLKGVNTPYKISIAFSIIESEEKNEPIEMTGKQLIAPNINTKEKFLEPVTESSCKEFFSPIFTTEQAFSEISLDVPVNTNSKYLLKLVFYSINKMGTRQPEKIMTIPLVNKKGTIIDNGRHILTDDLSSKNARKLKKKEKEPFEFVYDLYFSSSFMIQNDLLMSFLSAVRTLRMLNPIENLTNNNWFIVAITSINRMHNSVISLHFPTMFDLLMKHTFEITDKYQVGFILLIELLKRSSTVFDCEKTQHPVLKSFIYNWYPSKNTHEIILENFNNLLIRENKCFEGFKMYWVFFDLIFKSVCNEKYNVIGSERSIESSFKKKFLGFSYHVLKHCDPTSAKDFATLYIDLFQVLDRGYLIKTLNNSCYNVLKDNSTQSIKNVFVFYDKITDSPEFLTLNMPKLVNTNNYVQSYIENSSLWRSVFPLVGGFLHCIEQILSNDSDSQAFEILLKLLKRHENNIPNGESLQTVVTMYFPFVMLASSYALKLLNTHKNPSWALCFIFCLKNSSKHYLVEWWKRESTSNIGSFLLLLSSCPKILTECKLALDVEEELKLVIYDVCTLFSQTFNENLYGAKSPFISTFLSTLNKLLFFSKSEFLHLALLSFFAIVVKNFPAMFDSKNTFCENLIANILQLFESKNVRIRNEAVSLLFLMIQINHKLKGNFSFMKMATSVSLSRLLSDQEYNGVEILELSLQNLAEITKEMQEELYVEVCNLQSSLLSVCENIKKLKVLNNNPELKIEICKEISYGYARSLDLRVTWLNMIADINIKRNLFEEAAQTYVVVAYLIIQFIQHTKKIDVKVKPVYKVLNRISPNIALEEFKIIKDDVENLRSSFWNLEGLCTYLQNASEYFQKAKVYKASIEIYNQLVLIYTESFQYNKLNMIYSKASNVSEFLSKNEQPNAAKFFRASFYGKRFHENNGKSFVYREKLGMRIADFKDKILSQFQSFGKLDVLGNLETELEKFMGSIEVCYVQIANINQVSENNFTLDVAHSNEKNQQQNVANQSRKIIYFTTMIPFPHFNNRVEIVETKEVILNPLENAVQLLEQRVKALDNALLSPQATILSNFLYGNVMTTIAEGPEAICSSFLQEKSEKDNDKTEDEDPMITKLKSMLLLFLNLSEKALNEHESIMDPSMVPWQSACKERFLKLKEFIFKYI